MVDVGNTTIVVFKFFFMIDITQFYQSGYTDEPTLLVLNNLLYIQKVLEILYMYSNKFVIYLVYMKNWK